jgi:hypothetical protein
VEFQGKTPAQEAQVVQVTPPKLHFRVKKLVSDETASSLAVEGISRDRRPF